VIPGGSAVASAGRPLAFGDTIPQQQLDATRGVLANTAHIDSWLTLPSKKAEGTRRGPQERLEVLVVRRRVLFPQPPERGISRFPNHRSIVQSH
jgi:hypothetical protein